MTRVACLTVGCIAAAVLTLPAQNRDRGSDFGRADWCEQERGRGRDESACRILEETVRTSGTIDVDARQNGGIRVRGWDRDDVQVRARVVAWDRSASRAREVVDGVRLETSGGRVRAVAARDDDRWSASFELQVPQRARLDLTAHNGGLSLTGFDGTVVMARSTAACRSRTRLATSRRARRTAASTSGSTAAGGTAAASTWKPGMAA